MRYSYLILLSFLICVSCDHQNLEKDLTLMKESIIAMPYKRMIRMDCTTNADDSLCDERIMIVNYMNNIDCTLCAVKKFVNNEYLYDSQYGKDLNFLYIVDSDKTTGEGIYRLMEEYKSRGIVYIDSESSFMKKNPQVMKSELFHTFVMNSSGKVLLVGDPFSNEKMTLLFEKVLRENSMLPTKR